MESLTPAAKRQKTLTHRPAGYKKGPMAPKDIGPLLPQLLSFPPHPPPAIPLTAAAYDKEIKHLRKALNGIPNHLLIGGVPNGGDLLEVSSLTWTRRVFYSYSLDSRSIHQYPSIPLRPSRPLLRQ